VDVVAVMLLSVSRSSMHPAQVLVADTVVLLASVVAPGADVGFGTALPAI
jgi:hypothetical protein